MSTVSYRNALAKENSYRNKRREQLQAARYNQTQHSDVDVDMNDDTGPTDRFEGDDDDDNHNNGDDSDRVETDEDINDPDMLED